MNGNYGADPARDESARAHARAVVARELTNYRYNRASSGTWLEWLADHGVLAVSGVDTRALTRHLRDQGALRGVVSTDGGDVKSLRAAARSLPAMTGLDLAGKVTCEALATRRPATGRRALPRRRPRLRRQALDARLPRGARHARHRRARTDERPRGPQAAAGRRLPLERPRRPGGGDYAVKTVQRLLGKTPSSASASATSCSPSRSGWRTYKLKFGHRGANHPVKDLRDRRDRDHDPEPRLRRGRRRAASTAAARSPT